MTVRILFVCYGNICRSPTAEFVMKDIASRTHMDAVISSAGTDAEVGCDVWPGMREQLDIHKVPWDHRGARQLEKADYGRYDIIAGMDADNMSSMRRIFGGDPDGKLRLLLSDRDLDDPYYTGDYQRAFREISEGCTSLSHEVLHRLP